MLKDLDVSIPVHTEVTLGVVVLCPVKAVLLPSTSGTACAIAGIKWSLLVSSLVHNLQSGVVAIGMSCVVDVASATDVVPNLDVLASSKMPCDVVVVECPASHLTVVCVRPATVVDVDVTVVLGPMGSVLQGAGLDPIQTSLFDNDVRSAPSEICAAELIRSVNTIVSPSTVAAVLVTSTESGSNRSATTKVLKLRTRVRSGCRSGMVCVWGTAIADILPELDILTSANITCPINGVLHPSTGMGVVHPVPASTVDKHSCVVSTPVGGVGDGVESDPVRTGGLEVASSVGVAVDVV